MILAIDYVQENVFKQGQQSNESATDQAIDNQIADSMSFPFLLLALIVWPWCVFRNRSSDFSSPSSYPIAIQDIYWQRVPSCR